MKVMISGGTGMIGTALANDLAHDGHEVVILTRQLVTRSPIPRGIRFVKWDGVTPGDWINELSTVDAVVNLAGENLSSRRWSKNQKNKIINSRVSAGKSITEGLIKVNRKPSVVIQASGVGAYGTSEEMKFDESADYGADFLAGVTRVWEASTLPVENIGVRRVIIRSGVVLAKNQGALKLMLLPFKLFVGGKLGSGRQWISWIHLQDEVRAIRFLIDNAQAHGVYNLSATPVTNKQFSKTAANALKRPSWFPIPAFILRIVLGEMSTMVLDGQNVASGKIERLGFKFLYPKIEDALTSLL